MTLEAISDSGELLDATRENLVQALALLPVVHYVTGKKTSDDALDHIHHIAFMDDGTEPIPRFLVNGEECNYSIPSSEEPLTWAMYVIYEIEADKDMSYRESGRWASRVGGRIVPELKKYSTLDLGDTTTRFPLLVEKRDLNSSHGSEIKGHVWRGVVVIELLGSEAWP